MDPKQINLSSWNPSNNPFWEIDIHANIVRSELFAFFCYRYAFVKFSDADLAQKALESMKGRKELVVEYAKKKVGEATDPAKKRKAPQQKGMFELHQSCPFIHHARRYSLLRENLQQGRQINYHSSNVEHIKLPNSHDVTQLGNRIGFKILMNEGEGIK